MDFIVKVGVEGYQFSVNIPADEKFQYLQEIVQQQTKIEFKNQLLLSKKGIKVEDLQIFNTDSQLLQTNQFQDQRAFAIYLFDLSESVESLPYQMAKFEPKMDLKQLTLNEQAKEILSNLNGNIINQEKIYFQHLQNIRSKYLPYQQKIKSFEKLGQELENQVQSFEVLLKMISLNYQTAKQKKNDVSKKCKDTLEKNQQTVKKFDDSLENLKKIELHVALQTDTQKYLSDIYYRPESMHKWKNSCLNTSSQIRTKLDKTTQYLKKLKIRIKEERNTTISNCINAYKTHQSQFQSFIQESKQLIQSVVQTTMDEYNTLRQHMITFSQDINDEPALFYISQFELGPDQIKQFDDAVIHLSDHLDKVNKSIEVFNKLRLTNQVSIQSVFKIMRGFNKDFDQLNDKMKLLDDEVEKMDKDFSYLLNPVQLPQAYQSALLETSRRREFRDIFEKKIKTITNIVDQEKEKRKKFLQTYGRILPQDFFGQLKNLTPQVQVVNATADLELPNITGCHQDTYKKKDKQYSNSSTEQLHKQIEDLSQQCKQTHLYYDEKTPKKQGFYNELLCLTATNAMKMFTQRSENIIQTNQQQSQETQKKLSQYQVQIESLNTQIREYEQSNKVYLSEMQEYCAKITAQQNELDGLKQKLRQAETEKDNKKSELDKQLGSYNTLLEGYVEKSDQLEQAITQQQEYQEMEHKLTQQIKEYINKIENLEIVISQKNTEITSLKSLNDKDRNYEAIEQQYKSQIKGLSNKIDNLEQIVNQKTNEAAQQKKTDKDKQTEMESQYKYQLQALQNTLAGQVQSYQEQQELQDQEHWAKIKLLQNSIDTLEQSIENKNNEIFLLKNNGNQQNLELIEEYQTKINELNGNIADLKVKVAAQDGQIKYLNEFPRVEFNVDIVKSKLQLVDEEHLVDLSAVKVGKKSIFIPASNGMYVPLILKGVVNSQMSEESFQSNSTEQSVQNRMSILKLDSLQQTYKEFILDTGLIIVAEVTNIQELENSQTIEIAQPQYIIGFEETDNVIRNFIL